MNSDKFIKPKFAQLCEFASELLQLIDNKKSEEIEIVCEQIEKGNIVNYFQEKYSFQNMNSSLEGFVDVNTIMKKMYVSDQDANCKGFDSNGIAYIIKLILDDISRNLFNMECNDVNPDEYRLDD